MLTMVTQSICGCRYRVNCNSSLNYPVPFVVVGEELKNVELKEDGGSDIAPTILDMMNLEQPEQMTGHSLIK